MNWYQANRSIEMWSPCIDWRLLSGRHTLHHRFACTWFGRTDCWLRTRLRRLSVDLMPQQFQLLWTVLMAGHELGIVAGIDVLYVNVGHHCVIEATDVRLLGHNASHVDVLQVDGPQFH